jgi:hypothetical protein
MPRIKSKQQRAKAATADAEDDLDKMFAEVAADDS